MFFPLSKFARNKAFWVTDKLQGGTISAAVNVLKNIDRTGSKSSELTAYRNDALKKLIKHAVQSTDFYRSFDANADIASFPVVDKAVIKQSQDLFLSKDYAAAKLYKMVTSGSTGMPFTCYQDREKKKRVNAEIIYYSGKAGYQVGKKLINLKSLPVDKESGGLKRWIQNVDFLDVSVLNDSSIDKLLKRLENLSKDEAVLLAYASTYDQLSDYFGRKGNKYRLNISGLLSSSEILYDDTRDVIEKMFGCRCLSRYSNQENGVIGQDDLSNNIFLINEAHYNVEIMKLGEDIPCEEGQIGRIVVTDYFNYAMPMIRYDTGDIGKIIEVDSNGVVKKAISDFRGRKIDLVYDSNGYSLSPHKISVSFRNYDHIKQFQFIQEDAGQYLVRIKAEGVFNQENDLKKALKTILGEKASIVFEYTNSIPVLKSGKRNYILNHMVSPEGDANG